jgi:hypothetical protein
VGKEAKGDLGSGKRNIPKIGDTVRRIVARIVGLLVIVLAVILFVYIILLFDPFGWGLVQSDTFTWEEFEKVRNGDRIESVVERLGEPVRPPTIFVVLTTNPDDPCFAGGCKEYIFAGAIWGATFKEAIVIVDQKGYVIHAVARQE